MFFTFFRSACTTQNFRAKRLPHQKSNGKKHRKTLAVTSFTHDIGAKRLKENKVVKMDHSPGWGSICCLGEEKWSARKQLRWGTWVASSWKHLHASSWPAANLPVQTCSAWIPTQETNGGTSLPRYRYWPRTGLSSVHEAHPKCRTRIPRSTVVFHVPESQIPWRRGRKSHQASRIQGWQGSCTGHPSEPAYPSQQQLPSDRRWICQSTQSVVLGRLCCEYVSSSAKNRQKVISCCHVFAKSDQLLPCFAMSWNFSSCQTTASSRCQPVT